MAACALWVLQVSKQGTHQGKMSLTTYAKDHSSAIQYNLGLQLLLDEQPEHACVSRDVFVS